MKKKLILLFVGIFAVGTFLFLSPIFIIIFGLCGAIIGAISLIKPTMVKSKINQPLNYIRLGGSLLILIGFLCCYGGGILFHHLYPQKFLNTYVVAGTTYYSPDMNNPTKQIRPPNPVPFQAPIPHHQNKSLSSKLHHFVHHVVHHIKHIYKKATNSKKNNGTNSKKK